MERVVDAVLKVHRDCLGDLLAFVVSLSLRTDRVERLRLEATDVQPAPIRFFLRDRHARCTIT
jgi:hypothetical protein